MLCKQKLLTGLLSLSLIASSSLTLAPLASANTSTPPDDPEVIAQRASGLALWNGIRSAMGSVPLAENLSLTKAAQNHANYLGLFTSYAEAGARGHDEREGETGFTGVSMSERTSHTGYTILGGIGEVLHYIDNANNNAIQGLIDAPYHRSSMLNPTAIEVGIGIKLGPEGRTVADLGYSRSGVKSTYVYPYNGQINVPVSWLALESPNPLAPFGKEGTKVGYPISISTTGFVDTIFTAATIKDASGVDVPFYKSDATNTSRGTVVLTPKSPLAYNTTYTVTFTGSANGVGTIQKTWSFTTTAGVAPTLRAARPKMDLDVGHSDVIGINYTTNDGDNDVTHDATYSSSTPNLKIDGSVFTASAPFEDATVTYTYKGLSTVIHVSAKVTSKLPTNYDSLIRKMYDVRRHWAEQEIAWAIQQSIAQGYEDKTFRPNGDVTEAEFLAFVLRALKSDSTGASLAEIGHWSDSLYAIGKKYSLPLNGYSDQKLRETKITRQQVAEIIAAVDGQHLYGDNAINYLLQKNYSSGKTSATLEGYKGNDTITRAEAIKFLLNLLQKGVTTLTK